MPSVSCLDGVIPAGNGARTLAGETVSWSPDDSDSRLFVNKDRNAYHLLTLNQERNSHPSETYPNDDDPTSTDRPTIPALTAALILGPLALGTALAYDVNDKFSIGGILAAAGQCQNVSAYLPAEGFGQAIPDTDPLEFDGSLDAFGNECRGGMPIQVEFDFHPTENNQFFVALG